MEIDGAAHLILDQIQGSAGGPALLAGDGDAPDPLGGPLHQGVDMRLAGRPDDHDVVGPVPGGHPHAADVVLEAARGNLGRDDAVGLGIDIAKAPAAGQGDGIFQGLGGLIVGEIPYLPCLISFLPPMPGPAGGMVIFQSVQDLPDVQPLVRIHGDAAFAGRDHFFRSHAAPPAKSCRASSQ